MSAPWHEDDALWARLPRVLFSARRLARAETEVQQLTALLDLRGDETILDMPCGIGRHAVELARRGHRVTGVDRTAGYLDDAARRAADGGLEVEWVCNDMRAFRRDGVFDVALNMYTSLGYFADLDDDRRVLENVHASLRPGGRLVVETNSKEVLAAGFQPRVWHDLDDGGLLLEERQILDGWRSIRMRWIIIDPTDRQEVEFTLRLYAGTELAGLLDAAGFAEVALYGNLDGDPYDEHARRLVAVARRT